MRKFVILAVVLVFTACSTQEEKAIDEYVKDLQEVTVEEYIDEISSRHEGYWRNNTINKDYNFIDDKNLLILEDDTTIECTYEVETHDVNRITFWFKCPQPDWPGYTEFHEFHYTDGYSSFVDTLYIQGSANRVDGVFEKFGD